MRTLIQLFLDMPDEQAALALVDEVVDLVDAVEVGRPLYRIGGPALARACHERAGGKPLILPYRPGESLSDLMEIGAAGLTVPGEGADEVTAARVEEARGRGLRVLLDLRSVMEPTEVVTKADLVRPDLAVLKVTPALGECAQAIGSRGVPLGLAADVDLARVPWLLSFHPRALLVGPLVSEAPKPRHMIEAVRARIDLAPSMRAFY